MLKKLVGVSIALCSMQTFAEEVLLAPVVDVTANRINQSVDKALLNSTGDAAYLLQDEPGISFYQSGGVSALPSIRGMNDDRIKILIDGAEMTSACGNHMNPPLSYIAPTQVSSINMFAGITPVSMGGDSIAGTIAVNSLSPKYSTSDALLYQGSLSSFYRSNNNGLSTALSASVASENLSLGFTGTIDRANSYEDGKGNKVRSTQFDRRTQTFTLGARGLDQQFTLRISHQDIPYQGFVNQYMDMVGNQSNSVNANYSRQFAWGDLDTRVYWQDVDHEMGFFSSEKLGQMPMKTQAKDYGYSIKASIPWNETHLLRVGNDYHRNNLNDYWPPVAGSMMMGPLSYININNGRRERFGLFAEVESKWTDQWSTLLGVRDDFVKTDTGDVQPYNMTMGMMTAADINAAKAFNSSSHAKSDNHLDLVASAKFEPFQTHTFEFGYARKTRSPSLYERYSWGRGDMAMRMIGWFGDANGYVGDPDLKPETANTISASVAWHDVTKQKSLLKITPYFTYVQDYIGATRFGVMPMGGNASLQFENHDAQFYGVDINWKQSVWDNAQFGQAMASGVIGWARGERVNSDEDLYHIMPLNAKVRLDQKISAWTNTVEMQLVDRKNRVDPQRFEPETSGYTLVNLRTSYQWTKARFDLGVTNLFDKFYYLPLGGVNVSEWRANNMMEPLSAVAGMGRSINVGMTLFF